MAQLISPSVAEQSRRLRVGGLLDEARDGSVDALGSLFQSVRAYLLLAATKEMPRSLRGKLGASDVVQETVLQAHRSFGTFRGGSVAEFFGWIRGILRHQVVDTVRRYEVAQARDVHREVALYDTDVRTDRALIEDDGAAEMAAIRGEDAEALEAALRRLPVDQRTVIWLRHWEGRSYADIGARCGKSEEAIRKIWVRGILRLEELLRCDPRFSVDGPPVTP